MDLPQLEANDHDLPVNEFGTVTQLLADTGHGDDPTSILLTCWELGFAPDQVSFGEPGEIMVVQNPGGLVPSDGTHEPGSSLDTVRYALNHPTVRHLIVCGHTDCKTLHLLLDEHTKRKPNPFDHLTHSIRKRVQATYADRPQRDWRGIVVQETVLQQLANLRSHEDIRERLEAGELQLHGWLRDDETGVITAYNPISGQFSE